MGQLTKNQFVGLIEHPFKMPGLLTPVFEAHDGFLVTQLLDDNDLIQDFIPHLDSGPDALLKTGGFPVNEISEVHNLESFYARKIGDVALVCLRFPEQDAVLGTPSAIRAILSSRISEFESYPSIFYLLSQVYGDDDLANKAEQNVKQRNLKLEKARAEANKIHNDFLSAVEAATENNERELSEWLLTTAIESKDALPRALKRRGIAKVKDESSQIPRDLFYKALVHSIEEASERKIELEAFAGLGQLAGITNCTEVLGLIEDAARNSVREPYFEIDESILNSIESYPAALALETADRLTNIEPIPVESWTPVLGIYAKSNPENYPEKMLAYYQTINNDSSDSLSDLISDLESYA